MGLVIGVRSPIFIRVIVVLFKCFVYCSSASAAGVGENTCVKVRGVLCDDTVVERVGELRNYLSACNESYSRLTEEKKDALESVFIISEPDAISSAHPLLRAAQPKQKMKL